METGIGFMITLVVMYFAPWLVALMRRHHNAGAIFVLNLLAGWTFFGWVAAMVWAMTSVRPRWDGELVARSRPGGGVAVATRMPSADPAHFLAFAVFVALILIALFQVSHAGPVYRGNAAPGMMNRGPEANYYNRARPPTVTVPSYGGLVYSGRPFVPNAGAPIVEPPAGELLDEPRGRLGESAPVLEGGEQAPRDGRVALHNGSLMRIVMTPDGYVDIFYVRPRPGLPVLPGARLLRGQWTGPPPQNLVAVAFVFPPYPCPPVPYGVRGTVDQGDSLVLYGPAPIVAPGCRVIGHDWTKNSELRFVPVR